MWNWIWYIQVLFLFARLKISHTFKDDDTYDTDDDKVNRFVTYSSSSSSSLILLQF